MAIERVPVEFNRPKYGYEELRNVIVDVLTKRVSVEKYPEQWLGLQTAVAEVLVKRHPPPASGVYVRSAPPLYPQEAELVRDAFWDLFRQGFITLGFNDSNPTWPWFRLSHTGTKELLAQQPYRFHDAGSFFALLHAHASHIEPKTQVYLREAISAFYAGSTLASTVMLGVAAESDFLRVAEMAANHATHGSKFHKMAQQRTVSQKMEKFRESVRLLTLPQSIAKSLDTHFSAIQNIIRIARNDSGHPTGNVPSREDAHLYIQLFIPYAKLVGQLRQLSEQWNSLPATRGEASVREPGEQIERGGAG